MKKASAVFLAFVCTASAQLLLPSQTIVTRWGTRIHKPYALERAVREQDFNELNAYPELHGSCCETPISNRREAEKGVVHLMEVVKVQITRTVGEGADAGHIVINLIDIDGNRSSIWTGGKDEKETLPVTGVEPY